MQRRSMLMRLLGLCGFAAHGLNAVTESVSQGGMMAPTVGSSGKGWIGLAVIGEVPKWYPPRRQVERLRNDGLCVIKWEEMELDDWVLITDFNELGRPYNQEAFVAGGHSSVDSDPFDMPLRCAVPITLKRFWAMVNTIDRSRLHQMVDNDVAIDVSRYGVGYMKPDVGVFQESDCDVPA